MNTQPHRRVALIPLKPFRAGKQRLRVVLRDSEVENLMRRLAQQTISACEPLECWVICEDDEVATFAVSLGAKPFRQSLPGLNAGVSEAYRTAGQEFDSVLIAHADLASPGSLGTLEGAEGVTIVTDHHGTGTNVLLLPTRLEFEFHYGPNSAQLHELEAQRLHLPVRLIHNSTWAHDIDEPTDL